MCRTSIKKENESTFIDADKQVNVYGDIDKLVGCMYTVRTIHL